MSVFVDTSVWFGAANSRDRQNARAKKILGDLASPVLTDHVLIETWTLLNARLNRQAAERFWLGVRRGAAQLENVLPVDLETAWMIGETFQDQDFSIVDRTSFAVMQRVGVLRVATLDDHFAVFRFGRNRTRAFEVVR